MPVEAISFTALDRKRVNPFVKKFSKGKYSTWKQIEDKGGSEINKLKTAVRQKLTNERKIDADPNISRVKTKTHPYAYGFGDKTYYYNKPKKTIKSATTLKGEKNPEFIKWANKEDPNWRTGKRSVKDLLRI